MYLNSINKKRVGPIFKKINGRVSWGLDEFNYKKSFFIKAK